MASGAHHCKDCGLYFDSSQSLDVHLQYHKENLMSMWMTSEEIKRENTEGGGDMMQMTSGSSSSMTPITSASGNLFKQEPKDHHELDSQASFLEPSPISPMDYDFKVDPCISSPQSNIISQGPPSGSGTVNYSQSSPNFYSDYSQQPLQQHPNPFGGFSSTYTNGAYDEHFYNRGNPASRYHPYLGRSPVPTPSPGAATVDVKEERLTPSDAEILDLDSQKVLNSSAPTQQTQMGSLPAMWRPHETFASLSPSNACLPLTGMGPSPPGLRTTSGLGPSPTGLGPSPTALGHSPTGLGPSPTGLSSSSSSMGQTTSNLGATSSVGLGPSSGMGISSGLSPASMSMLPPMQQPSYGTQHILNHNHQIISPISTDSSGFASNSSLSSYYSTGLTVNSGMSKTSTVQFASNPAASPSSREGPPTEYPSNVKRVKSFKCEDCNKWFTSHGHLKRHYNTTLHKNMTKLNSNNSSASAHSQNSTDLTRPPILSPSSKSIGESSTTSSHDDESNLSTADPLEPTTNTFQPTGSAFQPPVSIPTYSSHNTLYAAPSSVPIVPISPALPHYSQAHSFQPEQPLTAPTMYHGHFSTNPSPYAAQAPVPGSGSPFFLGNNYIYQQQGGLHGPGFHSVNEYLGPSQVDGFNTFRLDNNDRLSHHIGSGGGDSVPRNSPEPTAESGSEASMDSSESNSTTGASEYYKCNECNKTFNRMCYLTQHRSTYHEGEKPYKCGTCGKRFTDELTFNDHQGKHAGEKPYKCEVCPKQFNHKTDLRRHMCLHTGEKPFSCEQCGKGFIRKDHMLKHFQTHRKKALAAAANAASSHPSMPPNPPGFQAHPGLPPPHGSLPHPSHGPRGHPHVVAPPVY